jgi:hypothetical protein
MTTFAQVLLKKELITSLAKQFGYTDEVKIYYDVPGEDDDEKIKLRFVVKEDPEKPVSSDPYYERSSRFGAKLSAELSCVADIVVDKYVPNLQRSDVNRKSALITDELAIKEVIYRINNDIPRDKPVNKNDLDTIRFEEVVCKNIDEKEQWLQDRLLKKAEEYLKKNATQQTQSVSSEEYNTHGLLPEKKRKKETTPEGQPSQKRAELKVKGEGDSRVVELTIPIPENANYDEKTMVNPTIADELALEYFVKVGGSTPSPTKSS